MRHNRMQVVYGVHDVYYLYRYIQITNLQPWYWQLHVSYLNLCGLNLV
jgi:hypothetical protein